MKKENRNTGLSACVLVLLINASLVSLSGCGGGSAENQNTIQTPLTSDTTQTSAQKTPPEIVSLTSSSTTLQTSAQANLSVTAKDADGDTLSYTWSATGGSLSSATVANVTYTAPSTPGTFTVTVKVSDGTSEVSSSINIVVITPTAQNQSPVVSISASATSGTSPLTVQFIAGCTDDGSCASFYWNFGDGTTSTAQNPSHQFITGIYGVNLTVTDDKGAKGEASVAIQAYYVSASAKYITAGYGYTCAVTTSGGVKCWGMNAWGQLGTGTKIGPQRCNLGTWPCARTAVDVTGLTEGVKMVSAGTSHTCAVMTSGGLKCWGDNDDGQLGAGIWQDSYVPVDAVKLTVSAVSVAAINNDTYVLTSSGGVKQWSSISNTFEDITGWTSNITSISAHTYARAICVLTSSGGVQCFGDNTDGELGTTVSSSVPVDVTGLTSGVQSISSGPSHSCAITSGGGVKCWGAGYNGQLGQPNVTMSSTPVDVYGLGSGVTAVSAGANYTCALLSTGGVRCWGTGYGSVPVDVTGLTSGVSSITAGWDHTCAILTSGEVKCWGGNSAGQLGNTTTTDSSIPVNVIGFGM